MVKSMILEGAIKTIRSVLIKGYKLVAHNTSKKIKYTYGDPELVAHIKKEIASFNESPLMSIIIPVYNVEQVWLEKAIQSVERQWYKNWEIILVDDASTNSETIDYLKGIVSLKIKIKFLKENGNISKASNEALSLSQGDYIVLLDHDDELTPDALYEVVKAINASSENDDAAEFIYSDEDKLAMDGSYCDPHFKPDFSPELFLSQNYISHLVVIKKSLVDKVGGWTIGLEGSQDYDLYLRVLEYTNRVVHIPKVLYHWRKIPGSTAAEFSDKSYAQEAGRKALENAMQRRDIPASVVNGKHPGTYRVQYEIIGEPLVSIIVPFNDKPELLDMCINSVLDKSTYKNYEIIGINNNSGDAKTFAMMEKLKTKDSRVTFYDYHVPFNYSKINNHAVKEYAKGEHILLLNNDIEIITPEWIEAMLEFSQRKNIGAVGAKLYYPNDTIQHAGVAIGVLKIAGHSFKNRPRNSSCYMGRESVVQNISAVTAACLMVKKSVFNELNGLNEVDLKIAFNDIDFCLRIRERGYLNVFTPYCEAYHHESLSRGVEDTPEKKDRFHREIDYVLERHKDILEKGDPYYNVNLSLDNEQYRIRR